MDITDLNKHRRKSKLDREKDRLRQIDQYYEYCLIKDWDNLMVFTDTQEIQIGDVFANLVEQGDKLVLTSILFFCSKFSVEQVLDWLDTYGLFWQAGPETNGTVNGATEIVKGLRFKGQPLILYRRGLLSISYDASQFPEVTDSFVQIFDVTNTANAKDVSLDPNQYGTKVYINGEEVDKIPELEFDLHGDFVYINGLLVCADRIGEYNGAFGVFRDGQILPIGWISNKDVVISINLYESGGSRLCNIKFTYSISLDGWKKADLESLSEDINKAERGGKTMDSIRLNKNGLPVLTRKMLDLIFECVYGWPDTKEINKKAHLAPLRDLPEDSLLKDYLELIEKMSIYNYRHRFMKLRDIFSLADPIIGPFEINSEGTSLWLARILAIKELYGLNDTALAKVLIKIKVRL